MSIINNKQNLVPVVVILGFMLLILGCGKGNGITLDDAGVTPSLNAEPGAGSGSQHMLWGYWEGYIPEAHDSLELVPVRGSSIHLNARRFLEYAPCTDCLTLENIYINHADETLTASIQLRHPFPGLDKFTGFNVRAVVITDGSREFPGLGQVVPDYTLGDFTLMEPDGYTALWSTVAYPEGSGVFPILEYSRGNLASPGEFSGTVNPYIDYATGGRMTFPAGEAMTKEFLFKMSAGAIRFGYAIDGSWEAPLVDPPVVVEQDFPMSANCMEPIFQDFGIDPEFPLYDKVGFGKAEATVFDYQGVSTVSVGHLECPDLWDGVLVLDSWTVTVVSNYGDYVDFDITLENQFSTAAGEYPALLEVVDKSGDYWLGDVNRMYQVVQITVEENIEPDLNGQIVFSAPGPDTGGPPPAQNVWVLDVETMEETQITEYYGLGAIYFEPRINPSGTHVLLDFSPTPYAGHVDVYEIGGMSWTASPGDVYDGTACFHPDGEHILVVSGTEISTTTDLYSMAYDGTERTLIAKAPDVIRNPRCSPDGSRIVMSFGVEWWDPPNSGLYVYDVGEDTFTEIMSASGMDECPCWSPVQVEGRDLVVFESSRDHHPDYETDIYVIDGDTEEVLYHLDTGEYESHPSFAPDGLSFVFNMTDGTDEELYICYWQTGEVVKLTDDETWDGDPSWSWNW